MNDFLHSLGAMQNRGEYKVFVKGATGPEVIIQFALLEKASHFIEDKLDAIKKFQIIGTSQDPRHSCFNHHVDESMEGFSRDRIASG